MHYIVRKPWDPSVCRLTEQNVYRERRRHRREFLKMLGLGGAGIAGLGLLPGCQKATDEEIEQAGQVEPPPPEFTSIYPAARNDAFEYGRPETSKRDAAEYTNFYEFSVTKASWKYVEDFVPSPWSFEVTGLCRNPRTFDMDDLYRDFTFEERAYRHRCVETWAMCVPWTGFPLKALLEKVEPLPTAKYVKLVTFERPEQAANQRYDDFPWPYTEGLTLAEATNDLTLLTTGVFGEPLPKQHGAPVRIITPWKYGFKCIKSIVGIELTGKQPATFWNSVAPREYGFEANVEPDVPHPRWSQKTEWMLGTQERFDTKIYNGYGDWVGELYV